MPDPETVVIDAVRMFLERRDAAEVEFDRTSQFHDDLELDSLELAELSAILEDTFGRDPYTAGIIATSVEEVVQFYR